MGSGQTEFTFIHMEFSKSTSIKFPYFIYFKYEQIKIDNVIPNNSISNILSPIIIYFRMILSDSAYLYNRHSV